LSEDGEGQERGINWLVEKIRRGERIEEPMSEPLFDSESDTLPLFLHAALLDGLHDIWRLNSQKLIYRLGVIMGHKLRVELGEKLGLTDVGSWEGAVEQVGEMLELFCDDVTIAKVSRLYARFEVRGCPCSRMNFALKYCPEDVLIEGIMAGFAQRITDDNRVYCRHKQCVRREEGGEICVHELRIKEAD
jgi:hypothetical protein